MRILVVEHSERLRQAISTALRGAHHAVDLADTGADGLARAMAVEYDVIILDMVLPGTSGLALLRALRAGGRDTHVLLLTAKDVVAERVTGLRTGADDCLEKPPVLDELAARVEALGRRRPGRKAPVLRIGNLAIDPATQSVTCAGDGVALLPREYALLAYLASRAGQIVSRQDIMEHIYDGRLVRTSNVIDVAVSSLRRKIDRAGEPSHIVTCRRAGYRLVADK